uniref:A-kinase anchor protein 2 C-terminal domain-containing protein n=1 Tax=Timema bartmani TaxID=61472 RepID=A0A7R9F579_9NEOP|nr:unnamed protein product [Timema bartmani]
MQEILLHSSKENHVPNQTKIVILHLPGDPLAHYDRRSPTSRPGQADAGIHPVPNYYQYAVQSFQEREEYERERQASWRTASRPRYTPAEEKIQVELKEMQKREEELRLQRAHLFAVSQPNLMNIIDDEDDEIHKLNGGFNDTRTLRTTQSIPNLLDAEDSSSIENTDVSLNKPSFRNPRKRNSLIAEWESRITKNVDQ